MAGPGLTPDAAAQDGMTMIEVIVAFALVMLVVFASLAGIQAARKSGESGKRGSQGIALAQREVEAIKALPYDQVALHVAGADVMPTHEASGSATPNPASPNYYTDNGNFRVMRNYADQNSGGKDNTFNADGYEPLFNGGAAGGVTPKSSLSFAGTGFTVWRYVTYRREAAVVDLNVDADVNILVGGPGSGGVHLSLSSALPSLICAADDSSKRVTVAVLPAPSPQQAGPTRPTYVSTVITKPGSRLPVPLGGPLTC